jgi:4-hydroxy-tetrahydrodipicolinate reductase
MEAGNIRVAVVGAGGRMGQEVLRTLVPSEGFDIVAAVDSSFAGTNVRELAGPKASDVVIKDKLGAALDQADAQVLVDFSHASAAPTHALSAIKRGVRPVIGVTGISKPDLQEISFQCRETKTGGIYAPNFAIGAVLMMRFAEMAAQWYPDAEIIELHHDRKEDAPSGTAILTAEKIGEARKAPPTKKPRPNLKVEGARGGKCSEVNVHSVRLPGCIAHQMVLFGGEGETLTIRHDSMSRGSFMYGVKLATRRVLELDEFLVGLDRLIFEV